MSSKHFSLVRLTTSPAEVTEGCDHLPRKHAWPLAPATVRRTPSLLVGTLNGSDKAKLVKKARKLSQVFGDVAVLEALIQPPVRRHSQQLDSPVPTASYPEIHGNSGIQHDCQRNLPSSPQHSCQLLLATNQSSGPSVLPPVDILTEDHDQRTLTPAQLIEANATKLSRHLGEVITPELIFSIEKGRSFSLSNGTDRRQSMDPGLPTSQNEGMKLSKPQILTRSPSLSSRIWHHTFYGQSPKDAPSRVPNTRYSSIRGQHETTKPPGQKIININHEMSTQTCPEFHNSDSLLVHEGESYEQKRSFDHSDHEDVSSVDIEAKDAFQDRRRRAAKLSQFFGVNTLDIASSSTSTTRDYSILPERNDQGNRVASELIEVEVSISGRRFKPSRSQDARMGQVRDQLRGLRAT